MLGKRARFQINYEWLNDTLDQLPEEEGLQELEIKLDPD